MQCSDGVVRIGAPVVDSLLKNVIANRRLVFVGINVVVAKGLDVRAIGDPGSNGTGGNGGMAG